MIFKLQEWPHISIVKSCGFWLIFDDDIVDVSNFLDKFYIFLNAKMASPVDFG